MEEEDNVPNCDGMIQTKICQLMFSMDCHKDTSSSSVTKGGVASPNDLTYTCGRCGHSEKEKNEFDLHLDSCRSDKSALCLDPPKPSVIKINRSLTKPIGFKLSGGVIATPKVSESPSSHCEKPVHVHMQVIFNSPNGSKSHSCKSCREMPASVLWFKAHENGDKRSYICHVCQSTFFEFCELIAHNGSHEQEVPHKCGVCGRCFETSEDFMSHHQVHVDQLQCYRCDKCDKAFTQELCLRKHMRSHFQLKEHRCYICEKVFLSKSKLEIHMRIHTGEKPYHCEFCDKSFTRNIQKQSHIKKKHSGNSKNFRNGLEVSKEAGIKTLDQMEKVETIVKKIRDMHNTTVVKKKIGKKSKNTSPAVTPTGKRRGRPPKELSQKLSQNTSKPPNDKNGKVAVNSKAKLALKKKKKVVHKPNLQRGQKHEIVKPEQNSERGQKPKLIKPEQNPERDQKPKNVIPEPTVNLYSSRLRSKTQIVVVDSEKQPPPPHIIVPKVPWWKQERKRLVETPTTIPTKQIKEDTNKVIPSKSRTAPKPRMLVRISVN